MSNILQQIYESLILLNSKKKYSQIPTKIHHKVSSSLSDIKNNQRYLQPNKKQHKHKYKTQLSQRYKKQQHHTKINQAVPQITNYINLLKKRRSPNFILPQNYSERRAKQIKKSVSQLSNHERINISDQYSKKKFISLDKHKQQKKYNNVIEKQNCKILPLINLKKLQFNYDKKDLNHNKLSVSTLKNKIDQKQCKKNKIKKLKVLGQQYLQKASALINTYFQMENYEQILQKIKNKKKLQRNKLKRIVQKSDQQHKKPIKSNNFIYKMLPSSYLFKKKKQANQGFSPWQSISSNFILHPYK